MTDAVETDDSLLTEVERALKERFNKDVADKDRLPSTAADPAQSKRVAQLTLPLEERGKMPLTKDKYMVKENPHLVAWEREVRQFLRKLSPRHGHRVSAVMIYEWATGIKVADLMEAGTLPNGDLRKINQILEHHFGKSYQTYIAGRKVAKAYRIPQGWYVKRHRPVTLTLYAEWLAGTLNP